MPEINLNYPILIEIGNSSGSGFFFHHPDTHRLYLATAEHVLFNQATGELLGPEITLTIPMGIYKKPKIIIADVNKLVFRKKDSIDIVIVEIAKTGEIVAGKYGITLVDGITKPMGEVLITHVTFDSFIRFKEVKVGNDVFVLGYPSSLSGDQIEYNKPLLRKGIIAGVNVSLKTIIIDCPVYFGNSGGLALQVTNDGTGLVYEAIGVVSKYVPFVEQLTSQQHGYTNLNVENSGYGIVVPTDTIFNLTSEEPEGDVEIQTQVS